MGGRVWARITLIAAFVAAVLYFQWRTAHQRVALDLFDRRLRVFEDIEQAVGAVFKSAQATKETFRLFVEAQARARFLFGGDINDYLKQMQKDFAWLLSFTDEVIAASEDRSTLVTRKHETVARIIGFSEKAPELFSRYMRMDQRGGPGF